jgi:hypothetical protein
MRAEDHQAVERENNAIMTALANDVAALRNQAKLLEGEAISQNAFVTELMSRLTRAGGGVKGMITNLNGVMARNGCNATVVYAAVVFGVLLLLFYGTKHAWNSRATETAP